YLEIAGRAGPGRRTGPAPAHRRSHEDGVLHLRRPQRKSQRHSLHPRQTSKRRRPAAGVGGIAKTSDYAALIRPTTATIQRTSSPVGRISERRSSTNNSDTKPVGRISQRRNPTNNGTTKGHVGRISTA